jgi:type II secretory pathway component PulF
MKNNKLRHTEGGARVADAWERLPEHVRKAILTLIEAAEASTEMT